MAAIAAQRLAEQQPNYQVGEEGEDGVEGQMKRFNNTLPLWGNKETMNINHLILSNIRGSPYFKTDLFKLKTYHEVIDEIYYKVRDVRKSWNECTLTVSNIPRVIVCSSNSGYWVYLHCRLAIWNRGRRTVVKLLVKLECVLG